MEVNKEQEVSNHQPDFVQTEQEKISDSTSQSEILAPLPTTTKKRGKKSQTEKSNYIAPVTGIDPITGKIRKKRGRPPKSARPQLVVPHFGGIAQIQIPILQRQASDDHTITEEDEEQTKSYGGRLHQIHAPIVPSMTATPYNSDIIRASSSHVDSSTTSIFGRELLELDSDSTLREDEDYGFLTEVEWYTPESLLQKRVGKVVKRSVTNLVPARYRIFSFIARISHSLVSRKSSSTRTP